MAQRECTCAQNHGHGRQDDGNQGTAVMLGRLCGSREYVLLLQPVSLALFYPKRRAALIIAVSISLCRLPSTGCCSDTLGNARRPIQFAGLLWET